MQLYYHQWACSLAPLIAATEAGIDLDLVHVDIIKEPHVLKDGSPYEPINPKLYVPALRLEDGSLLTEVAVILQYLADRAPEAGLAPPPAAPERYRLQEVLNFIATELHKFWSPWLFHPELGALAHDAARARIASRLALFEGELGHREYAFGDAFSVADAYLFTMVNWAKGTKVPLADFPNLQAWMERVATRPAVQQALARHV